MYTLVGDSEQASERVCWHEGYLKVLWPDEESWVYCGLYGEIIMELTVEKHAGVAEGRELAAMIQQCIDDVHAEGGGTVHLEPGVYPVTTLFMRSGVELHLMRGAVIQAWHQIDDYPDATLPPIFQYQPRANLIAAIDCKDISITGDGVIDGQDLAFWDPCTSKDERPYGIFRYKVRGSMQSRPSPLVQIVRCRNVRLDRVLVQAAPGWAVHVYDCDHVSISGLTIRGHRFGPHTDGIGINGSRDVRIMHCDVDTGDDAIIVKSTDPGMECRNITVTNCIVASNCAGLGLGADVYGSISDVIFSNCVVKKALRMIQVEMWFPGQVQRAIFKGITGRTYPDEEIENERPIYVDIQEQKRPGGELGSVQDLVFRDIVCESRGRILLTAQDGAMIDGVTLDHVLVRVPEIEDPATTVPASTSLQLSNFSPLTRAARAAVVADNVQRLTLRDVEYCWPEDATVRMHGLCIRNVSDMIEDSPRLCATHADVPRVLDVRG